MEQILYLDEHPFAPRQLAELVWTLSHRNIMEFLAGVPRGALVPPAVRGPGDAIQRPQMEALCASLGLGVRSRRPAALRGSWTPRWSTASMPESAPMGDPGFLAHGRIDPSGRRRRRSAPSDRRRWATPTLELAARLRLSTWSHRRLGRLVGPSARRARAPARPAPISTRCADDWLTRGPRADRDRRHGRPVPGRRRRRSVLGQSPRRRRVDPAVHGRRARRGRRRPVAIPAS